MSTTATDPHHPVTPGECGDQIRDYGSCQHGPAYPTTLQKTTPWADSLPRDRANIVPEVATASDETLVSALLVLTHGIHGATDGPGKDRLRLERDLVRAEVLHRMGGPR